MQFQRYFNKLIIVNYKIKLKQLDKDLLEFKMIFEMVLHNYF